MPPGEKITAGANLPQQAVNRLLEEFQCDFGAMGVRRQHPRMEGRFPHKCTRLPDKLLDDNRVLIAPLVSHIMPQHFLSMNLVLDGRNNENAIQPPRTLGNALIDDLWI